MTHVAACKVFVFSLETHRSRKHEKHKFFLYALSDNMKERKSSFALSGVPRIDSIDEVLEWKA